MNILLTGATGFIGKQLILSLLQEGHTLVVVTRNILKTKSKLLFPLHFIEWDLEQAPLPTKMLEEAFSNFPLEGVINLMGENIGEGDWTSERKQRLWE